MVCASFVTSGLCPVCLYFVRNAYYAICVIEGHLRGRHPLPSSCTLKMGMMKARVEVRHYVLQCTTRCTVLSSIDIYTHNVHTYVAYRTVDITDAKSLTSTGPRT